MKLSGIVAENTISSGFLWIPELSKVFIEKIGVSNGS